MKNKFKIHNFRILESSNDIIISIEKDNFILDMQELLPIINNHTKQDKQSLDEYNIFVAFYGTILTGSKEIESNPLFFGELDKEGVFIESKPIYHLTNETDSNSIESTSNNRDSNNSLSTLQVFLGGNTLTLLNYSLIDSSLNIKLESKSKESKEILEREKAQKQKDSSPMAQNDNVIATAFLHPILEDNELKCPHNGVAKLKSNKGKPFKSRGIPMILESDLLHSSIVGCPNPPTKRQVA